MFALSILSSDPVSLSATVLSKTKHTLQTITESSFKWSDVQNIIINVHTEEDLNVYFIPDNETATAEGKDQLQLRLQIEVD